LVSLSRGLIIGKQIKFAGEADEEPGYQTGDLIFILQELKNESFTR
jgi:DnaJ-class molecular chaperone